VDNKNLGIGVLTITATILLAGNVLVCTRPEPAYASGMTVSGGDYILTVGRVKSTPPQFPEDLLYVVDTAVDKMVAYYFDARTGKIRPISPIDLKQVSSRVSGEPADAPGDPKAPPTRPGTRQPTGKRPTP